MFSRIVLHLILLMTLSLTASLLSTRICVGYNDSDEAAVGVISMCGFPIHFVDSAPGYSMFHQWNGILFLLNTACWALFLSLAFYLIRKTITTYLRHANKSSCICIF
jgi:hypothetical protein